MDKSSIKEFFMLKSLAGDCVAKWQDKLIFISGFNNDVIIMRLSDGIIENIFSTDVSVENGFRFFYCNGNKLILVPYAAEEFIILDLITGEKEKRLIVGIDKHVSNKFVHCFPYNGNLICVGEGINEILTISLEDYSFKKRFKYSNDLLWSESYVEFRNVVYRPSRNKDKLLIISMRGVDIINIKGHDNVPGFLDIVAIDDELHIFDNDGYEYICMMGTDFQVKRVFVDNKVFVSRQSFVHGDKVYRVALFEDAVYYRNKYVADFEKVSVPINFTCFGKKTHLIRGFVENNIFYFRGRYGEILKLNLSNNEIVNVKINVGTYGCYLMGNVHKIKKMPQTEDECYDIRSLIKEIKDEWHF